MTDQSTDKIYFGVTVTRQRAEFLTRMLEVPLCQECGRESAECDAEPCLKQDFFDRSILTKPGENIIDKINKS